MIYLIACNRCSEQYVGQMVGEFSHRQNNYKDNTRNFETREHCMQRHLLEHFILPGQSGFLNDASVTAIAKTNSENPA